jgi:hypothetical protein
MLRLLIAAKMIGTARPIPLRALVVVVIADASTDRAHSITRSGILIAGSSAVCNGIWFKEKRNELLWYIANALGRRQKPAGRGQTSQV